MNYEFTMDLDVHSEDTLFDAAFKYATEVDKLTEDDARELLRPSGELDVSACVLMLLDPGTLPGCSINESHAEGTGVY